MLTVLNVDLTLGVNKRKGGQSNLIKYKFYPLNNNSIFISYHN